MAGGLFNRIKNFVKGEVIKASEINAEFNNIITNLYAPTIEGHSRTVGEMQTVTDPGSTGSESLATSIGGELERLRFVIKRIVNKTNWYDAPDSTLSTQSVSLAFYLPFDSSDNKAGGGGDAVDADFIGRGGIINAASLSVEDVVAADFDSTAANVKFGAFSYITGAGNILAYPGRYNAFNVGTISMHFRNFLAGDYLAFNPLLGIEMFLNASGFLQFRTTKKTAAADSAKDTTSVTGSASRAGNTLFQHAYMRWRFNGQNGAATDSMELGLNGVAEGSQLTSQTLSLSQGYKDPVTGHDSSGSGGYWFFGCKKNDPSWDKFTSMSGLPSAHSDPWTAVGTAGAGTVSSGVLTIATTGAQQLYYERTSATLTGVNLADQTVEFKFRCTGAFPLTSSVLAHFSMRDDSVNRTMRVQFRPDRITVDDGTATDFAEIHVDCKEWHIYRITSSGSPDPTVKIYIDGILRGTYVNNTADATANDDVRFGDANTTGSANINQDWEWVAYHSGAQAPVVANTAAGNLDDILCVSDILVDSTITSLVTTKASSVLGTDRVNGITFMPRARQNDTTVTVTAATMTEITELKYYFPSDGKSPICLAAVLNFTEGSGTATSFYVALVIDDNGAASSPPNSVDLAVNSSIIASGFVPVCLMTKETYNIGLHKASIYVAENGAGSILMTVPSNTIIGWREGGS